MHEVGLMQQALEIAEEQARLQGAACIHRLTLRVGAMSGAEPDALAFAFEAVAAGTMAEGASAGDGSRLPVVCYCRPCVPRRVSSRQDCVFACPQAAWTPRAAKIRRGEELELASMEVSCKVGLTSTNRSYGDSKSEIAVRRGCWSRTTSRPYRNRDRFRRDWALLAVNVLSSPGSGKTALLERTLADLARGAARRRDRRRPRHRQRRPPAAPARRRGGADHHRERLPPGRRDGGPGGRTRCAWKDVQLLFIENVGNLVCPASFDLGEEVRVVLLSVTEGEDKPLKYPKMFKLADLIVVTKTDLAPLPSGLRPDRRPGQLSWPGSHLQAVDPRIVGHEPGVGLDAWYDYLEAGAMRS